MAIEEGDLVLCTVERIDKTVVFVKINTEEGDIEGSIITSEIAAGRIRNIRDYVVPKKKIVCKVLRVKGNNIELSLRRVSLKERNEVMEEYDEKRKLNSLLKTFSGENYGKVLQSIRKDSNIIEFLEEAKKNPSALESLIGKEQSKKLIEILSKEKKKNAKLKKEFYMKTKKSNGLSLIKDLFSQIGSKEKSISSKYLASGKYSISIETSNPKEADNKLQQALKDIEQEAKKRGIEFSLASK